MFGGFSPVRPLFQAVLYIRYPAAVLADSLEEL